MGEQVSKGLYSRIGYILGSSLASFSHTSHAPPQEILRARLKRVQSSASPLLRRGHPASHLRYAAASFQVSVSTLFLTVCFQRSSWSDPWIRQSSHVTPLLKLGRGSASLLHGAWGPGRGVWSKSCVWPRLLPFSSSVIQARPVGLLASWTYQGAFYLKAFTWAILFAWTALSLDTHPDIYRL